MIFDQPTPKPGTRYRIIGPRVINGMNEFDLIDLRTGKRVGPPCFSAEQAADRARDLLAGKKLFWMGQTRFTQKHIF